MPERDTEGKDGSTEAAEPGVAMDGTPLRPPELADPPAEPGRRRIGGLDAARALAIVGMVMVHFGPGSPPPITWLDWSYGLARGRASLLFVLLAGIGMTLLAGNRDLARLRRAWPRLAVRIAVLLPLGLSLQLLDIGPLVILHFYAIYFLLAIPALLASDRLLLTASALLAVVGPACYYVIEQLRPDWVVRWNPVELTDPPLVIVRELLISGSYPAIVWLAPFLFGMWLGRRRLHATGTRLAMLVGGAAVMLVTARLDANLPTSSWWQLVSGEAHSQMIVWLVGGLGAATATLALCLWLTDWLGRLMWPLVAMGQLALTVYVGHLLLLAAMPSVFKAWEVDRAAILVANFTAGVLVLATLWRLAFSRGPLEGFMHLLSRGLERVTRRRRPEERGAATMKPTDCDP
ncbi:MAG: DUF418 domain-containing protein [Phycisphaeraceae bacterium]